VKRKNSTELLGSVVQARAGLIPESDWIVAEVSERKKRTERIDRAIRFYAGSSTNGPDAVAISEILADLRHCCDSMGLIFEELDRLASEDYEYEAAQSRIVSSPLN
jgi:hypothetical protein